MDLGKELVGSLPTISEALRDNPIAANLVYCILGMCFAYFFVKMILDWLAKFMSESKTDKMLDKVDKSLTKNVEVLGKVVLALDRIEK